MPPAPRSSSEEGSTGRARRHAQLDDRAAEQIADIMFALSTPSRVQILGCLLGGPHSVSELTHALGMEQSAVSHQLRVLREHKLAVAERVGRRRVYAVYDEHVAALFEGALRHIEQRRRPRKARRSASGSAGG